MRGSIAVRSRTHAVILAGGAGERFWPASRRAHPKPFLRVQGGHTLLEATLERARQLAGPDRIWLVCGTDHVRAVRASTGLPASRVLAEPARRNTALAVGLAACRIEREDPEAILAVLPADHLIPDTRAFTRAMRRGAAAAASADVLVTLGVRPTRPATGYGYIKLGDPVGDTHPGLHRVQRFVEKPNEARARRYLRQGGFLWNAGIFAWSIETLLEEFARSAPELSGNLGRMRGVGRRAWKRAVESAYRRAPSLPIDIALLERSRRVWVLPVSFRWSDVGTWASLAEALGVGRGVSRVIEGDTVLDDANGNLVWAKDRVVALLGVEGLAVVDTPDALLVTRLDGSADVRRIVAKLRSRGATKLL